MKRITLLLILVATVFCAEAQPANDNCPGITLTPDSTCINTAGTIDSATFSGLSASCGGLPNHDVFYNFVATQTQHTVTVTGCAAMDPVIRVYSGSCGGTTVGCFNVYGVGVSENATLTGLTVGATYWIRVYDFSGVASCTTFNICVSIPPPPTVNDNCPGTTLVPGFTCTYLAGTLASNSASGFTATCGGNPNHDVFYNFVATYTSHNVSVAPCASMNPVIQAYSGVCGGTSIGCYNFYGVGVAETATLTGLTVGATYWVRVYDLAGISACTTFNICVTIPPPPPLIVSTANAPITCSGFCDGSALGNWTGGYGPYSHHWTGPSSFTSSSLSISSLCVGTYTLSVTDSFNLTTATSTTTITQSTPTFNILASNDTSICEGGTAVLNCNFDGNVSPAGCGSSATGACTGGTNVTVGTGATSGSGTTYPSPFANWYTSNLQQFLYTAAELNAAGFAGGKIDRIDWNVVAINGISTYHNYEVKMGCTALTALTSTMVPSASLTTVFPAQTVIITVGTNSINFPFGYFWDGISNLIIQVCNNEGPPFPNYTLNSSVTYTTTTYPSSAWMISDSQDQCTTPTGFGSTGLMHPNMILHYCSAIVNPGDFSYLWTPSVGNIANDTLSSTTALPTVTTSYIITVTNTASGCDKKDTVNVTVFPLPCTVEVGELGVGSEELGIVPNPSSGEFRIANFGLRIERIKITNLLGQTVYQSAIANPKSEISLDISAEPKGVYFVQITTEKGISVRKIVKE